ncbi:MAG: sigma 54-interacting transcriptional regulator [Clostridium chrysemydis]|uniref:sigma 54-interacting transcriptional regulator n=1 Tax=Clostridium chrysemydis TaxID=2665504 RepID=UPI003F2E90CC
MIQIKSIINHEKGLHARVVAMVVIKANEINKKYNCNLYIKYKDREKILATSLMPLVLLKVKKGEEIYLTCDTDDIKPLKEFSEFIEGDFIVDETSQEEIDDIITDNNITFEEVLKSTSNGIIVVDSTGDIILTNKSADNILSINYKDVVGKNVNDILPKFPISSVLKDKKPRLGTKIHLKDKMLLINTNVIEINKELKGAVSIFEDISNLEKIKSELYEVKELKERLQIIVENVHDGICLLDKDGFITYVNKAYLKLTGESEENLLNKNIKEVSKNGLRHMVLKTGKVSTGNIIKKPSGTVVVGSVTPIKLDGEIVGVLSIIKDLSEVQILTEMVNEISAKAEYLEGELYRREEPDKAFSKFIGRSGTTLDVLALAKKAAKTNATVLIRGESGTGKELIAEGIHLSSSNNKGPFVRVNCAAIPENLLESELFGHEKGSFSGAYKRKLGKFELANNGTIFLDEIGEMGINMQAKILRVIQEREFGRVGGTETIKTNIRIIAATHRNLEEMVKNYEFREDLYYRLNVIPINIPPLRERKQDLAFLIGHFLEMFTKNNSKEILGINNDAMECFLNYKWPGNVRELQNLLERIVTLSENDYITLKDLPIHIRSELNAFEKEEKNKIEEIITNSNEVLTMKEYEKLIIEKALKKYGSFNAAGKALGLTHKTVAAKARAFGIEKVILFKDKNTLN